MNVYSQLESGSCLGAVKLSNFIPWDIDIDIEFATGDFHHFKVVYHFCVTYQEKRCFQYCQDGGEAKKLLEEAGISLYKYSEDMYHIKVK